MKWTTMVQHSCVFSFLFSFFFFFFFASWSVFLLNNLDYAASSWTGRLMAVHQYNVNQEVHYKGQFPGWRRTIGHFMGKGFQPPHDKTNNMVCASSEDSDQPEHPPSLIRVFAARTKKAWVLSYALSEQRRLIRLGGCPGCSESSLGAQSFCWFCHEAAHLCPESWVNGYVISELTGLFNQQKCEKGYAFLQISQMYCV